MVGNDFWEHLTGNKEFYDKLINAFSEAAIECNSGTKLETVIEELAKNIESQRKRA